MMKFLMQANKKSDSSSDSGEEPDDASAAKSLEGDLDSPKHPMSLARFLPQPTRRFLIKTLLMVLTQYSHCSSASQLSLQILGQIMTMFDVVDVCVLQKFVIEDFKKRHQKNLLLDELRRRACEEQGTEYAPVSKYKLDLEHMPSAQINQMTS